MITTGFPSPAQSYEEQTFDFNSILIEHPAATFCMRYKGKGVEDCGIRKGDILVIDCSKICKPGEICVTREDDKFVAVRIQTAVGFEYPFCYVSSKGKILPLKYNFGVVKAVVRLL